MSTNEQSFEVLFAGDADTVVALDRSAHYPAIGRGEITTSMQGVRITGTRGQPSALFAVITALSVIIPVFFIAGMWSTERWSVLGFIPVVLFAPIALLARRRMLGRAPFDVTAPWPEVSSVREGYIVGRVERSDMWTITMRSPIARTFVFVVDMDDREDFVSAFSDIQQLELTKVVFLEREVPEARVV